MPARAQALVRAQAQVRVQAQVLLCAPLREQAALQKRAAKTDEKAAAKALQQAWEAREEARRLRVVLYEAQTRIVDNRPKKRRSPLCMWGRAPRRVPGLERPEAQTAYSAQARLQAEPGSVWRPAPHPHPTALRTCGRSSP